MEKYIKMLSRTALFSGVTETELVSMLKCLEAVKKTYTKDTFIFSAGDTVQSMGLVLSGSVLIIQEDMWGRRNIIAKEGAGAAFAEPFAASGEALNISVIANENCEILILNVNRILNICQSVCQYHTKVIRNLVSVLALKALDLNEKITHIAKKSTKEKLLSYLSAESMRQKRLEFEIPYDRQQLADYLCVERAAMSVELSKLQKDGIISYEKKHFIINTDISDQL